MCYHTKLLFTSIKYGNNVNKNPNNDKLNEVILVIVFVVLLIQHAAAAAATVYLLM